MTHDRNSPDGTNAQAARAVTHCAGELWDAGRAFLEASQVNSGHSIDVVLPPWSQLAELDRIHFIGEGSMLFSVLGGLVVHVAQGAAR